MISILLIQMQEAEIQFLREQNALEVNRAKSLSKIEASIQCHERVVDVSIRRSISSPPWSTP